MNKTVRIFVALILIMPLYFVVFGEKGLLKIKYLKEQKEKLALENRIKENENRKLKEEIVLLKGDTKYLEAVARNEFGYIRKDELVIRLHNRDEKPGSKK